MVTCVMMPIEDIFSIWPWHGGGGKGRISAWQGAGLRGIEIVGFREP